MFYSGYFYSTHYDEDYCHGELEFDYDVFAEDPYDMEGTVKFTGDFQKNLLYTFNYHFDPLQNKISFKTDDGIFILNITNEKEKICGNYTVSNPYDCGLFQVSSHHILLDPFFDRFASKLKSYVGFWISNKNKKYGRLRFQYNPTSKEKYHIKGLVKHIQNYEIDMDVEDNIINVSNGMTLSINMSSIIGFTSHNKLTGNYMLLQKNNSGDHGKFQVVSKGAVLDEEFKMNDLSCIIN